MNLKKLLGMKSCVDVEYFKLTLEKLSVFSATIYMHERNGSLKVTYSMLLSTVGKADLIKFKLLRSLFFQSDDKLLMLFTCHVLLSLLSFGFAVMK